MLHCFEAVDLEEEGFALHGVRVAADAGGYAAEEGGLRGVGEFALEGAEAAAFCEEHVGYGLDAGLFAGDVCVGDLG